jgi:succinoglycan biosynthesis transport protein ExoP
MQENLDLTKIKEIARRRKWWLLCPFLAITAAAAITCLVLPNIYKSTAIILIRDQQIPTALVPSTVTTFAEERIQSISQEVMSRTRILKLVNKYDLLEDKKTRLTTEDLVDRIRKRMSLEAVNAEIHKETQSTPILLTIAFALSYQDENPKKAQLVTNEISSYYMEKNAEAREKSARGTARFLEEQLKQEKKRMDELRTKIAEFREAHLEELPDFMAVNVQKAERLNAKISDINMQIRSLEEQRSTIRNNMALLDPYSGGDHVLSPTERLQQARLERAHLLGKYAESHPAVQAIDQEIKLLEKTTGSRGAGSETVVKIKELEAKLATLRSRYGERHPSIRATLAELEKVKKEAAAERNAGAGKRSAEALKPNNPAYVGLQSDMDKAMVSITALKAEHSRLEAQSKDVYQKMQAMPQVAKQSSEMETEFQIATAHYNEIEQKLLAARVSQGMEEEQLGENFEIVEPAFLPEKPFKPNRLALMMIGIVLAAGAAIGAAGLREFTDRTIHNSDTLAGISALPVLSVIPPVLTTDDLVRQKRRKKIMLTSILGTVVGSVIVFHLFVMDLYIFYAKLERLFFRKIP